VRYRHLSPTISTKRNLLSVFLTVKLARTDAKSFSFRGLWVQETIEWE
jgi:hypothetical protein